MKSLSKIFVRYLLTAFTIIAATLFLNFFLYAMAVLQVIQSEEYRGGSSLEIAGGLMETEDSLSLTPHSQALLEEIYVWAMLLDDRGEVIWDWQLPEELDRSYSSSDIAAFSKWYLEDYPVTERVTDYGLLVLASPKGSIWKYNISDSQTRMKTTFQMIPVILAINLVFCFLLTLFMGFLFYRSLRGIALGIQRLSEHQPIHLPEKGMTEMLARQLNRTSDILAEQKAHLDRRDDARAVWIRGVSHDIRTPLSLIMGYASSLKEDPSLSDGQRHQANLIELQSLQIKHLIEDLNLTSRLEYEMQPLRLSEFSPSRLLRQLISDFYNQGLTEEYHIDLYIQQMVEQMLLTGDAPLLTRAFRNLIQNSVRHNPQGCTVTVTAYPEKGGVCFQISDNGCGIPENVIAALTGTLPDTEKAPHIMGLRIAWQIFKAHGWQMLFTNANTIHILSSTEEENPRETQTTRAV